MHWSRRRAETWHLMATTLTTTSKQITTTTSVLPRIEARDCERWRRQRRLAMEASGGSGGTPINANLSGYPLVM